MGKTRRNEPRNGDFKKLKATSKKQRNKKRRSAKANLTRHLRFASEHRAAIDMTQMSAAVYMETEQSSFPLNKNTGLGYKED